MLTMMMESRCFFLSRGSQKEHTEKLKITTLFLNTQTHTHIPSPRSKLPRSVTQLKQQIVSLDKEYDGCQEIWANGEALGFITEQLLIQTAMSW